MNGIIAWFAKNPIAANLMMVFILVGGTMTLVQTKQEVIPDIPLDMITVSVAYPGASPNEVEEGICVRIEEAIDGLEGIKRVRASASESLGTVTAEVQMGADLRKVLDDIKARVDAIDTFPEESEKPLVQELSSRLQVADLVVSGDIGQEALHLLAERVRNDLAALPGVSLVERITERPYEISIEVSEADLRRYGLSFDAVATAVARASLDLPGGSVKAQNGEILLRTAGQAYHGTDFDQLPILTRADGTRLVLSDIATVVDGFAESDKVSRFDGQPAEVIQIFRVGEQDAVTIVDQVNAYVETVTLPEGASIDVWMDMTRVLKDRLSLLVRNGLTGLVLVFLILALFLRGKLAFWVTFGIPVAFMGTFWLMPGFDVSVNLVSLFAFIVVLGIVVDDAIVVGENIHTHQHRHGEGLRGAIEGAREVAVPVTFGVLTTIVAFTPLLNLAGGMGKMTRTIPIVVISCLFFSMIESKLILPCHLARISKRRMAPGSVSRSASPRGFRPLSIAFTDRSSTSVFVGATSRWRPVSACCCSPSVWWQPVMCASIIWITSNRISFRPRSPSPRARRLR